MINNTDQDILQETTQHSNEYVVAEQIFGLIENERFIFDNFYDHESEFDISFHYDTYGWGRQAYEINSYLEGCICQTKLPDDLNMEYSYTAFCVNPISGYPDILRSGYNIEIMDPEHVDYISQDKAMFTSHDLHIKFKILGERIKGGPCIRSDLYGGAFHLRIQDCAYGSTRRIVDILKELLKEEHMNSYVNV